MYQLMNQDRELCTFDLVLSADTGAYTVVSQGADSQLPWMIGDLELWLYSRSAPKHRAHIAALLQQLQLDDLKSFIDYTKGLTLTDTFWINQDGRFRWQDINLFEHDFDETIARIAFDGGMYGDTLSTTSPEFTTDGAFAKCWVKADGQITLLKKGPEGGVNTGLEPYSEQYGSDLLQALGVPHVPYEVVCYHKSLVCQCPLMTSPQEMLVPMSRCVAKPLIADILAFAREHGFAWALAGMLVFDYLAANDDRHLNNFGVLVDTSTYQVLRLVPVYDNGAGLLPMAMADELADPRALDRLVAGKAPRFYPSFYDTARALCTPSLTETLRNIAASWDFSAQPHHYHLPAQRLDALSRLVRQRAQRLL